MPTLYGLKPRFQSMLRPLVKRLAASGVTANQVTIATGVLSVLLGAILAWQHRGWLLLPPFLLLRMALNAIDGMLAREHNQQSQLGAVLNELFDVLSDAALIFPLATLPDWNPPLVACAIFFATLTEIAGILANPRLYNGPFGKSDRAFALGAIATWLAFGLPVNALGVNLTLGTWILLCCFTTVNRVRRTIR